MSDIRHAIKVISVLQTPPPLIPMGSSKPDIIVKSLKLKKVISPEDNQIKAKFVQELVKNMKTVDQSTIDIINSFVSNTEACYVEQIKTLSSTVLELKQTKDKLLNENQILNKKLQDGDTLQSTPNFKSNMLDEIRGLNKKFLTDLEGLFSSNKSQNYNIQNDCQTDETLSEILTKVIHRLQNNDGSKLADLRNPLMELFNLLQQILQLDIDTSIDICSPLINDVNMGSGLRMDNVINLNTQRQHTQAHYKSILNEFCKYMGICQEKINECGDRHLHQHVLDNNVNEVIKHLIVLKLQGITLEDICNDEEHTPLHYAVMNETSPEIFQILFKYGGDLRTLDGQGNTILHLAVMNSTLETLLSTEVLEYLDTSVINDVVNYYNDDGYTALHLIAQNGRADYVRMLLNIGADIDVSDKKSGRTPIFHATESNHVEAIAMFLKKGADIHRKTYDGFTLLQALDSSESDFNPETKRLFYKDRLAAMEHKQDTSSDESDSRSSRRTLTSTNSNFRSKRRKVT